MSVTVYHNPRCSKSRAALTYLEDHGIVPTVVHYLKEPLSTAELAELFKEAGISPHDAIRRGEPVYQELGLSTETSNEDVLAAMAAHPILIERPIVRTLKGVRIARPTALIAEII
ncbi:arsenate reductase (glutaredoxin) [Corynebacterium sp. H128]|uniref:arsenate reductase (glutaredoxin) n=1 Tax=unclassified Corynebacterium TaxID=2624378 RepID=UPI0030B12785